MAQKKDAGEEEVFGFKVEICEEDWELLEKGEELVLMNAVIGSEVKFQITVVRAKQKPADLSEAEVQTLPRA